MMAKLIKQLGWTICGCGVRLAQIGASLLGQRRRIDVLIYKVDRLGDWFMAEPSIVRVVLAARTRGETVSIWASQETAALRAWRDPGCVVESILFEPRGVRAKVRRTFSVLRLLAVYQVKTVICLRHSPEPVRDFVLARIDAEDVRALSWRIFPGTVGDVPHEIMRHHAILTSVGLAPSENRHLLPALAGRAIKASGNVVIAPFSSALIKDWGVAAWCEIVAQLARRNLKFELWVGSNQIDRAGKLAERMAAQPSKPNVAVRSGALSELAEAVAAADLVLSVDTFAAHLAVALDVPTVCLIGGGQFGDFAPWRRSPRQRWVSESLPCFGCGWHCTRSRVECLEDISPQRIMGEIETVWRADGLKPEVAVDVGVPEVKLAVRD